MVQYMADTTHKHTKAHSHSKKPMLKKITFIENNAVLK